MKLSALIAGDEPRLKSTLRPLLEQLCPELVITACAQSPEETLLTVRMHQIDVIFLDIRPCYDVYCFRLLETLHGYGCDIVFLPAYVRQDNQESPRVDGQPLSGDLDHHMLFQTISRIRRKKETAGVAVRDRRPGEEAPPSRIALSDMYTTWFVPVNDIAYLESKGSYTIFHLQNKQSYTKSRNLRYYEDALIRHLQFLRVHKSFVVNRSYVKAYRKGSQDLELSNGVVVPMSIGYRALLDHWGSDFIH